MFDSCRNSGDVVFPRPLWPLVDRDLLVETYFPGQIVRHYVNSEHPLNHRIAEIGLDAYLQMMLVVRLLSQCDSFFPRSSGVLLHVKFREECIEHNMYTMFSY